MDGMTQDSEKVGLSGNSCLQKKRGRPFLGNTEVIAVRVPEAVAEAVRRRAKKVGMSVNMYLAEFLFRNEFKRKHRSLKWQKEHRYDGERQGDPTGPPGVEHGDVRPEGSEGTGDHGEGEQG